MSDQPQRKPDWLKIKIPSGKEYVRVKEIISRHKLHTICSSGKCPNMAECWGLGTATFMILGDVCTRSCKFCATKTGKPEAVDAEEPGNLANSIKLMNLKHCVITSVDRDDLTDGGAKHWTAAISEVKKVNPGITIEALIPDFMGKSDLIKLVIDAKPEVISHNLETVRRLTSSVRSAAQYDRSLDVIRQVAGSGITAKSGIMVGLGETEEEVFEVMDDLLKVGCSVMTIGQYLQPTKNHLPVIGYIHPDIFKKWEENGIEKGFKFVESKPLVRSSYHAEKHVAKNG
jgi:lipoic acid synthetase